MSKTNLKFIVALSLIIILSLGIFPSAHPGRTDANGGHYDRATGEYHYHIKNTTPESPSENTLEEKLENNITNETIVVDNTQKQLQKDVIKETNGQTADVTIEETSEIEVIKDKNGDTYIYIPKKHIYSDINTAIYIILIIFAFLGLVFVSPIIYMLLKKVEGKRDSLSILLHIPYLIFWLPSYLGNLLYKVYSNLRDESDNYEDDDF